MLAGYICCLGAALGQPWGLPQAGAGLGHGVKSGPTADAERRA